MSRITKEELLLEGWHGIFTDGRQFWAHPHLSPSLVRFGMAARLQRGFNALEAIRNNKPKSEGGQS